MTAADTTLSERKAAAYLGFSPATLKRMRDDGDAPPHYTVPRPKRNLVRYPFAGLQRWKAAHGYREPDPRTPAPTP